MLPSTPLNDRIGFALSRIVVPLWILAGVVLKMQAGTAANLPSNIVDFVRPYGTAAMDAALFTLIGLEIFAILVMVGIKRLARPMALFMLTAFCLILIAEMAKGADNCGCFGGTINIQPWQMLVADGLLLLGVALFAPARTPVLTRDSTGVKKAGMLTPGTIAAAVTFLVLGLATSFTLGNALHQTSPPEQATVNDEPDDEMGAPDAARAPRDPYINPAPKSVPRNWFPQNIPSWAGQPWREIEVFQFMPRWPAGLDEGVHYVVFYRRSCNHCEDMFYDDFTRPLGGSVVAIQIPETRAELTGSASNIWDMPPALDAGVTLMNLPVGPDWALMTPPLALRIENGIVMCANEGDHIDCFQIE